MKTYLRIAALLALLIAPLSVANAAVGTIYFDTGGCESTSTTKCSGTTDSASASAKGAGSTITCSATAGVGGTVPGCTITGTGTAVGQLGSIAVDGSQAVFINCATNSNQKIFWITAVDNSTGAISTISTVGTPVTPSGCTAATSDWGIGGRMVYNSANFEAAPRGGDTLQFNNTPPSKASTYLTTRTSGDSTLGNINVIGKAGVTVTLQSTGNFATIGVGSALSWSFSNLTLTSGGNLPTIQNMANGWTIDNVRISQTGTGSAAITVAASGFSITNSDITSTNNTCIDFSVNFAVGYIGGNYIHNCGGTGLLHNNVHPGAVIEGNLIINNTGRGIYLQGASTNQSSRASIIGNTIYGNAVAGIEVLDADTQVTMRNNIIVSTTTAIPTVKWAAGNGQLVSQHAYNTFWNSADSNSGLTNVTINATEAAADPLFTNAAGGNFAISNSSPAAGTGWAGNPPNSSTTGYRDMGAFQRQNTGGGGGGGRIIGG